MVSPVRNGSWWWIGWVLWCVPAGALAAWGLVEFYAEYPGGGYDGGFMGDLVLFGALLAFGQAPFVAFFVWTLSGAARDLRRGRGLAAAGVAIGWCLAGIFGWTLGSYVEVSVSESVPLYSPVSVLAGSVRWLIFAAVQGVVLAGAGSLAPGAFRGRAALFGKAYFLWVATSAVGGLLYEWWESLELAARSNGVNQAIGGTLTGEGVAENVAYVMVPHAIFVPILYGVPTGLAFFILRAATLRRLADVEYRPGEA